jgi:CRP-like cAMP-binding protein
MNDCKTSPGGNCLLSRLSPDTIDELGAERIKTSIGEMLQHSDAPITDLFFPTTAIISVVGHMSGGETAELGVIGNECAAGIIALMGAESSKYEKRVQVPGEVIKVPVSAMQPEFDKGGEFQKAVHSCAQKFTNQVAQTLLCNRWHTVEQRLVRWLLMRLDRIDGNVIPVTHEYMAQMLGVNRSTITQAAKRLQDAGFISYSWGRVTVIDREGLRQNTCECYGIIHQQYENN